MLKINPQPTQTYLLPNYFNLKKTKKKNITTINKNEEKTKEISIIKKLALFTMIITSTAIYSSSKSLNWPIVKGIIKRLLKIN